jgi:hypothetical protein
MLHRLQNESGVAFLTVMLLLLILSVIGIGSITLTGRENQIAGLMVTSESSASAAESCMGTAVTIIQQTIITPGVLPTSVQANQTPPGPVPTANYLTLQAEILGQPLPPPAAPYTASFNYTDLASPFSSPNFNPNMDYNLNNFRVTGDIDHLYIKAKAGAGMQQFGGYEGMGQGASEGGTDHYYRVDCYATRVATGTVSHVSAVYYCTAARDGCEKKPS